LIELLNQSSSPYINRFLSADTIVPGYANPQNLNRYGYVRNNPLRYIDPTGHMLDEHDGGGGGYNLPSLNNDDYCSTHPLACGSNNNSNDDIEGYTGPLHSDVQDQLISQGANEDLLSSVTIHVMTEESESKCSSNQLAVTSNNNIYVCTIVANNGDVVYDAHTPTPVLLHELVHVKQFRDNNLGTWIEINISTIKQKILGKRYNPYKESWVEIPGSACQSAYSANSSIPLDSGVCNLK
jgi:hypothetical protein